MHYIALMSLQSLQKWPNLLHIQIHTSPDVVLSLISSSIHNYIYGKNIQNCNLGMPQTSSGMTNITFDHTVQVRTAAAISVLTGRELNYLQIDIASVTQKADSTGSSAGVTCFPADTWACKGVPGRQATKLPSVALTLGETPPSHPLTLQSWNQGFWSNFMLFFLLLVCWGFFLFMHLKRLRK